MTREQYKYAEDDLISRMQVMMERKSGALLALDESSDSDADDDGYWMMKWSAACRPSMRRQ